MDRASLTRGGSVQLTCRGLGVDCAEVQSRNGVRRWTLDFGLCGYLPVMTGGGTARFKKRTAKAVQAGRSVAFAKSWPHEPSSFTSLSSSFAPCAYQYFSPIDSLLHRIPARSTLYIQ